MEYSAIQILITLVAIPSTLFFFQRFVSRSDAAREAEEANWRTYVREKFESLEKKLTTYCTENHTEHDELYESRNDVNERVKAIETTHHQRGCDQPIRRETQ